MVLERFFGNNSSSGSYTQARINRQRTKLLLLEVSALFITGVACLCAYAFIDYPQTVDASPVSKTTAADTPQSAPASPAAGPVSPAAPAAKAVSAAPAVPNCAPAKNTAASAPAISADQPGLHQAATSVNYYAIYGNTKDQITYQMSVCAPLSVGEGQFAASTDYAITWQVRYQSIAGGLCAVASASVGLGISQNMPAWQPSASATAGLGGSWQSFVANLATHENGHAQLDQQYAGLILNDLQNFPPTGCASINAAVTAKFNADIAALDQANIAYDNATNHGATQGALLRQI